MLLFWILIFELVVHINVTTEIVIIVMSWLNLLKNYVHLMCWIYCAGFLHNRYNLYCVIIHCVVHITLVTLVYIYSYCSYYKL